MTETPAHLLPTSCFICGGTEDRHGTGHTFWSNADALAEARDHDRRATFTYSTGETTVEGQHVASTRGR